MITQSTPQPDRNVEKVSPYVVLLLNTIATRLNGRVNIKEGVVETDCGYMALSLAGESTVYVARLMIEPDKQFNGCGTAFLQSLEDAVSKISHQTMEIHLWPVKSAIGFYLKNGYKLYVPTEPGSEYRDARHKQYGDNWAKYEAKVRIAVRESDGDMWTHETLWSQYEESKLFNPDNPLFYSFYVGDISDKQYEYAVKIVNPSSGARMSSAV